ncbi:alpha-aminoadipic semialdehyde synthase, mitochondrial-like [Portunus trituberculatus]|uniref:alpha-aminoadipic semialdehyde synthase, mitochondrial-like n=1 Tax=Portunus trituberculatus TaxID=210409 RepID=UPI001E1CDC64|nr:alpha-aminoadipic semialdehyde synthase, mitochondrial-like [Portunus trituberculatus]
MWCSLILNSSRLARLFDRGHVPAGSHLLGDKAGESDLVVLRHEITPNWPDGSTEVKGITLVEYGNPNGYSAMARTVGLPAAMCTKMVLGGEIQTRGCVLPLKRDIYQTVLARLRQEGIQANTASTFV